MAGVPREGCSTGGSNHSVRERSLKLGKGPEFVRLWQVMVGEKSGGGGQVAIQPGESREGGDDAGTRVVCD